MINIIAVHVGEILSFISQHHREQLMIRTQLLIMKMIFLQETTRWVQLVFEDVAFCNEKDLCDGTDLMLCLCLLSTPLCPVISAHFPSWHCRPSEYWQLRWMSLLCTECALMHLFLDSETLIAHRQMMRCVGIDSQVWMSDSLVGNSLSYLWSANLLNSHRRTLTLQSPPARQSSTSSLHSPVSGLWFTSFPLPHHWE